MWGCFGNCVGVLVIRVLVFTVFCINCAVFLYCFFYVYLFVFILSVHGPGSSVGIATAYGLDGPGIESRWGEIFRTSPDRP